MTPTLPVRHIVGAIGSVIGAVLLLSVTTSGERAPKAPPCPLTDTQTRKSIDAFSKIHAFVTNEPRCVNCHGGVNPYIAGTGLDPEDPAAPPSLVEHFVALDHKKPDGEVDQQCRGCHNNMAKRANGSDSLWMTAASFHSFVDKDAVSLCRQFKKSTGNAETFLAHIKNDEGGDNFGGTAFNGNRGLDATLYKEENENPQKPSLSHDEFLTLAQDWVAAMGGRFQGDEGCGCEFTHSRWSGQITYTKQMTGDGGDTDLVTWDGYSLTQITVAVTDGIGTFHGYVEDQYQDERRHWVALGGGRAVAQQEGTDTGEGSGDAQLPAAVDVNVNDAAGSYSIQVGPKVGASGATGWPNSIGRSVTVQCYRGDCRTTRLNIGVPGLPPMQPLSGKLKDRDRIDESQTVKHEHLGNLKNGTLIETMSVHLWRSSSN